MTTSTTAGQLGPGALLPTATKRGRSVLTTFTLREETGEYCTTLACLTSVTVSGGHVRVDKVRERR